ncbi:MAG: amidohydrolase [Acidimicrobiia bacterium]
MFEWDDEWLALHVEDVLDPDLEIVDPHHHLWVRSGQTFLLEQLQRDTSSGHRVTKTVFIEASWSYRTDGPEHLRSVGETEAAAQAAERSAETGSRIAGIVPFVDLASGPLVTDALDAHAAAAHGLLRGVRHAAAFDADPAVRRAHTRPPEGLMGTDAFRDGVRALADRGLTFDAWIYHRQIPELTELARAVPQCTIVLDHLGGMLGVGPYVGRRDEIVAQWKIDLAELAKCPNVNVKLGGIGMVMFGMGFEQRPTPPSSDDLVAAWGERIAYAIDQFGVDRSMFESNFPVDRQSCSYRTLWNAFKKMASGASDAEKRALFNATATRVYRL